VARIENCKGRGRRFCPTSAPICRSVRERVDPWSAAKVRRFARDACLHLGLGAQECLMPLMPAAGERRVLAPQPQPHTGDHDFGELSPLPSVPARARCRCPRQSCDRGWDPAHGASVAFIGRGRQVERSFAIQTQRRSKRAHPRASPGVLAGRTTGFAWLRAPTLRRQERAGARGQSPD